MAKVQEQRIEEIKIGDKVRIKENCKLTHLIGCEGIIVSRSEKTGYIGIESAFAQGTQKCTLNFPENEIEIIEAQLFPQGDKCEHKITSKLIEIPGEDGHMFGTENYIMDYGKLAQIAHKMATGGGKEYYYLEYLICTECDTILEKNAIFT